MVKGRKEQIGTTGASTGDTVEVDGEGNFIFAPNASEGSGGDLTPPIDPGDDGKIPIATSGDFTYLGGTVNGDTLIWDGALGSWVTSGRAGPSIEWFVNSDTGSDTADGITISTPLLTLKELGQRINNTVISNNTTITLTGTFAEIFALNVTIESDTKLQIIGNVTVEATGSVTTWTAYDGSNDTAGELSDSGQTFTGLENKRIRFTGGMSSGAICWILKVDDATTIIPSRPYLIEEDGEADFIDPTDTYNIETLTTVLNHISIINLGPGTVEVKDIIIDRQDYSSMVISSSGATFAFGLINGGVIFTNCQFTSGVGHSVFTQSFIGFINCNFANLELFNGYYTFNFCSFNGGGLNNTGGTLSLLKSVHINSAVNHMSGHCLVTDQGFIQSNASYLTIGAGATYESSSTLWATGATTRPYGITVLSNGSLIYKTLPTLSGAVEDTKIGGTDTAYASIPFINSSNNAKIVALA